MHLLEMKLFDTFALDQQNYLILTINSAFMCFGQASFPTLVAPADPTSETDNFHWFYLETGLALSLVTEFSCRRFNGAVTVISYTIGVMSVSIIRNLMTATET